MPVINPLATTSGPYDHASIGENSPVFSIVRGLLITPQAVNQFTKDADNSPDVPKLVGKCYADFRLTTSDWEKMGLMREFLQVCGNFLAFKHVVDLMIHATRKQ